MQADIVLQLEGLGIDRKHLDTIYAIGPKEMIDTSSQKVSSKFPLQNNSYESSLISKLCKFHSSGHFIFYDKNYYIQIQKQGEWSHSFNFHSLWNYERDNIKQGRVCDLSPQNAENT